MTGDEQRRARRRDYAWATGAAVAFVAAAFLVDAATAHATPAPFAPMVASWYGDEGGPVACGPGRIPHGQISVAHKTLPCGTRLTVCDAHGESCIWVRVTDRGPYVAGRDLDLSRIAARRLGLKAQGVATVQVRRDAVACKLPRWVGRPYRPLCAARAAA